MLTVTWFGVDQLPQVETPKRNNPCTASKATPAYWMLAGLGMAGFWACTACSSSGVTSETSLSGKVPVQTGPAPSVPVQRSVPVSAMVVEPVGLPPVAIGLAPAIAAAARVPEQSARRDNRSARRPDVRRAAPP